MAEQTDIVRATERFREKAVDYDKAERYYKGDHDLAYATVKFQNAFGSLFKTFAMNLCPAICDAVRDKLVITEFGVEKGGKVDAAQEAWKIWTANRMPLRAGEVHREALKTGDAYVIVWPDAAGKVTIYPNRAATCTVFYDEEQPGRIAYAAKHWKTPDKRFRLNLYYPDRVERYISKSKANRDASTLQDANRTATDVQMVLPQGTEFVPFTDDGPEMVANPYGIVPVFHFANNADTGALGVTEMASAIPVQDAMNKSVLDMLVAMEFSAFRQRWITGIDVEYDDATGLPKSPFVPGADRIWLSENPDAKFGDFEASDIKQFLEVKDGFRTDMACVTGTPLHYFMLTGAAFPQSGISVEKLESRFLSKVRDRMQRFGQVWEDVMAFALTIENKGTDVRLFAEWEDPAPIGESERLQNLILKQTLGVTEEQLWMEAGYGEEDIKRMSEEKAKAADDAAKRFNAGDVGNDL